MMKTYTYLITLFTVALFLTNCGNDKKKEPLKRTYPKFVDPEPIKPLTSEQLKEIGL